MPTYEYRCLSCDHVFDAMQPITAEPLKECPMCGGQVKRLVGGGIGLIFKGSGFYITDYGRKGGAGAAAGKPRKADPAGSKDQAAAGKPSAAAEPSAASGESAGKASGSAD